MKKYLTLQNCVICFVGALILAAFIMSFCMNFNGVIQDESCVFYHVFWGCDTVGYAGMSRTIRELQIFGNKDHLKMMGLAFAGLLMMILGTIAAILVTLFLKKPWAKYVVVGCAAVVLAGGIMQFFPVETFARSFVNSYYNIEEASQADIDKMVNDMVAIFKNHNANAPVAVVMGIFGCLSAVGLGALPFLPKKQLVK